MSFSQQRQAERPGPLSEVAGAAEGATPASAASAPVSSALSSSSSARATRELLSLQDEDLPFAAVAHGQKLSAASRRRMKRGGGSSSGHPSAAVAGAAGEVGGTERATAGGDAAAAAGSNGSDSAGEEEEHMLLEEGEEESKQPPHTTTLSIKELERETAGGEAEEHRQGEEMEGEWEGRGPVGMEREGKEAAEAGIGRMTRKALRSCKCVDRPSYMDHSASFSDRKSVV